RGDGEGARQRSLPEAGRRLPCRGQGRQNRRSEEDDRRVRRRLRQHELGTRGAPGLPARRAAAARTRPMTDASLPGDLSSLARGKRPSGQQDPDITVPSHPLAHRARGWLMWFVIAGLLAWSWTPAEMSRATSLFTDWRNMAEFGRAFLRPNFHDWDLYLADMIVTIQIAIWGTALSAVCGAPIALPSYADICAPRIL